MKAKKYSLIGGNIGRSYSKFIRQLTGIHYDLVTMTEDGLEQFVRTCDYDGFNVTMPFKRQILPYLDYISPSAKLCNAVNTVLKRDGKLFGYNTDVDGVKRMAKAADADFKDKNVLILGSGATSEASGSLVVRR